MKNYEDSLKVCREYLSKNPHVGRVFEKQNSFLYEYEKEDGPRLLSEITVKPTESFVILHMESGIRADMDALGITIQACQLCSSPDEPGMLMISPDHRYVTYLISSPIVDLPVCEETLAWMQTCAYEKINVCKTFLKMFGQNRLDPELLSIPKRKEIRLPEELKGTLQFAIEVLSEGFAETDSAAVNMLQRWEDPVLFFNEIQREDGIYYEKISVDPSGCLIVSIRPAIQIDRLEQGDLAPICNRFNCEQARNGLLGGLHAFSDDGSFWFSSPISLYDGLVSIEAVKAIEACALRQLDKCMVRWRELSEELSEKNPKGDEDAEIDEIAELIRKSQYQEDEDPRPMISFGPADDENQEETSKPDYLPEAEPEPVPPAPMLKQVGITTCWCWESKETEETIEIEFDPALYTDGDTSGDIADTNKAVDAKDKRSRPDRIDPEPNKSNSLDEAIQKHREFKERMKQLEAEARLKGETANTKPDN